MRAEQRNPWQRWWPWLLALAVIGAGYGLRDPWAPDEPRFVMIARDMVETGNWFIPYTAQFSYPDKPPIFMWFIALMYALTGSITMSFLFPSLVAGLTAFGLVKDLGTRLWHRRAGLAAALCLLVTAQFVDQSRFAQIDMLLVGFTTIALYGLCRHILLGPHWGWYSLAGVAMGFGIITKGVGFLPLLALLPCVWMAKRRWHGIPHFGSISKWALAPALMLSVIAAWLVPMLLVTSGDPELQQYRDNILFKQTVKRYAAAEHHHKDPFYYFWNVIPSMWLPAILLLPWLIPVWWKRWRRGDRAIALLLSYAIAVAIFFSFSTGKRGVYIFPALPAFALAAGPVCAALLRTGALHRIIRLLVSILAVLMVGAAVTLAFVSLPLHSPPPFPLWPIPLCFSIILISIALWGQRRTTALTIGFFAALWIGAGAIGQPLANNSISAKPFMQDVGEAIGPQSELGLLKWKEQFRLFADRPVAVFGYRTRGKEALLAEFNASLVWLIESDARWLLGPQSMLAPADAAAHEQAFDLSQAIAMGERHRETWYLVHASQLRPAFADYAQQLAASTAVNER